MDEDPAAHWRVVLYLVAIGALIGVITARVVGPSDLWDQTQPRTAAYTTDMLLTGGDHWLLPQDTQGLPATKPPLYNWLAAPFVRVGGLSSEIAHKFPSVIAAAVAWLMLIRIGRRFDARQGLAVGLVAAAALMTNYTVFKLAYLARPDMVLTVFTFGAWWAGMLLLVDTAPHRRGRVVAFWLCIALAGLTKGPVMIVPLISLVAFALIHRSDVRRLAWGRGVLICGGLFGGWLLAAYLLAPDHVVEVLWEQEILNRILGIGSEGNQEGLAGWLRTSLHMVWYYFARFLPWSIIWIIAAVALRRAGATLVWQRAAVIHVLVVLAMFSLSAGKRADYIAIALPQAAAVVGWWLVQSGPPRRVALFTAGTAVASLTVLFGVHLRQPSAPNPQFGDDIAAFISEVASGIDGRPGPVHGVGIGETHLGAMVGITQRGTLDTVADALVANRSIWLLGGGTAADTERMTLRLQRKLSGGAVTLEPVVRSTNIPRERHWPGPVTLYAVTFTDHVAEEPTN